MAERVGFVPANQSGQQLTPDLNPQSPETLKPKYQAAQNARQAVVALVTRELVEQTAQSKYRHFRAPRHGPGRRILDSECVADHRVADAREPLDHVEVGAGAAKFALLAEVRGLDDQGVAFPVAAGIALPEADRIRKTGSAIERDDSKAAAEFGVNEDRVRCLHELEIAVVDRARQHRRALNGKPQTALRERSLFRRIRELEAWPISRVAPGHAPAP